MGSDTGSTCATAAFDSLSLFGAEILDLVATPVTGHSASVSASDRFTQPDVELENATFCNITITYTHPGQEDRIIVEAWLPNSSDWNGRFQAVGGGGWQAGRYEMSYAAMNGAVADGYATITTDAGLGSAEAAESWALLSPGNPNLYLLQNLMSVSLEDEAILGKALINTYYGRDPDFSYWNGCSQGGRQGLMLAQRYPTAFDGIAVAAPAIYWTGFTAAMQWSQQVMHMLGEYPHMCETSAIAAAAIEACDGLDGVVDGIISDSEQCLATFDPFEMVGKVVDCPDHESGEVAVGSAAAHVSNATWHGRRSSDGVQVWPGFTPGSDITMSLANTDCSSGKCVGVPFQLAAEWLTLFVEGGSPDFDLRNLTHEEFDWLAHKSSQRYDSIIETNDPDLTSFSQAGGKLVTLHGADDPCLSPKATSMYFEQVSAVVPDTPAFYRHFEVPGMSHCTGGPSSNPVSLFDQLRAWVENGTAPDQTPVQITNSEGEKENRILCPYPQAAVFSQECGMSGEARCWSCSNS